MQASRAYATTRPQTVCKVLREGEEEEGEDDEEREEEKKIKKKTWVDG